MAAKIQPGWLIAGAAVAVVLAGAAGIGGGSGVGPFLLLAAVCFAVFWWMRWPAMKQESDRKAERREAGDAAIRKAADAPGFVIASDSPSGFRWFKMIKADGALWQGTSSVFNIGKMTKFQFAGLLIWMAIISGGGALLVFGINGLSSVPGWLMALAAAGLIWPVVILLRRPEFISERWALTADAGSLHYVSEAALDQSPVWSLPLADVASVEAGRTVEWQGVRDRTRVPGLMGEPDGQPGSAFVSVPEAEYQTFVMARDGRRLVVHTGNAEREATSALALSLRAWIEAQRSGLTVRPPVGASAPVSGPIAAATAPSSTSADDEGFSL